MTAESLAYQLTVNGQRVDVRDAWVGESLLYVLRERAGLAGTKGACEQGECGSCSVLLDGELVCSCLIMAATVTDAAITTIEGICRIGTDSSNTDLELTEVQTAFVDAGAVQCGFCTPGLVVAVHDLLERNPTPSEGEIRESLSGNLCRCTGYGRIFAAVSAAVQVRSGKQQPSSRVAK